MFFDKIIDHFLATVANEPSTIFTFKLPAQGVYVEKSEEQPVMLSEAPEYRIQGVLSSVGTLKIEENYLFVQ